MTQIPAGWYPDPDPDQPEPKGQRYWDGQQWTEHVQGAPGQAAPGQPAPYGGGYGQPGYAPYAGVQVGRTKTPDGQELAGWGRRLGAYLLDGIITGVIGSIVGWPWLSQIFDAYRRFFDEAMAAAERGETQVAGQAELIADITGPMTAIIVVGLVVSLVYHAAFLRWKAATPGKLALGLQVRLRETPGPLTWATILKRWVGQYGYGLATFVPLVGFLAGLYWLLDHLWPLWDSRRQALHDKVASTNVVRQP